jgi:phytoene synthase
MLALLQTEWQPAGRLATAAEIDETRFLVEAVAAMPLRDRVRPVRASSRPLEDRVVWVIDLFTRLERRDQLLRGGSFR